MKARSQKGLNDYTSNTTARVACGHQMRRGVENTIPQQTSVAFIHDKI